MRPSFPPRMGEHTVLAVVVAAATLFAAWLRLHGLADQVVLDDEWHALAKLMASGYGAIALSFGYADHSIPLTLLDKAIASVVGLDEYALRGLQVACGTALVPFAAWLAWRATRDAPVAALLALLLAAAPFLVLYSRIGRPYAITTLLACGAAAALWTWRRSGRIGLAVAAVAMASLATWLHPLAGLYPATACAFLVGEAMVPGSGGPARFRRALVLAVVVAVAMAAPILPPLLADYQALSAKAGGDHASVQTLARMLANFSGVLPMAATWSIVVLAALGAWRMLRLDRALGLYLVALATLPTLVVATLGAQWSWQGHTFARYVFPLQLILLFWGALGAISIAHVAWPRRASATAWSVAVAGAIGYLAATPTLQQVTRLGAWYAHIYHQLDYDPAHNRARTNFQKQAVPAFYRSLAELPPRSVTVLEAPFSFEAPYNPFAWFDEVGGQRAKAGLLGPLCHAGLREVPEHDPRFRFHSFVFLDDPAAVRRSGARYLALHLEQVDGHAFDDSARCIEALSRLYGPPTSRDARMAAWKLGP